MTTPLFTAGAGAPCPRHKKLEGMTKAELIERVELLEQTYKGYYLWGKAMHYTLREIRYFYPDILDQVLDKSKPIIPKGEA